MIMKHEANRCYPGALAIGEAYMMRNRGSPSSSFSHHVFIIHGRNGPSVSRTGNVKLRKTRSCLERAYC